MATKNTDLHENVITLSLEGKGSVEIGQLLGISRSRVSQIRSANGLSLKGKGNRFVEKYKRLDKSQKRLHTKLKNVWGNMKRRCLNPNNPAYPNYGGRGIAICAEWLNSYPAFKQWALENGYEDGLTLDRADNNSGYSPENCRWISHRENSRNTRSVLTLEAFGEAKCLSAWVEDERCAVSKQLLSLRISNGWEVEKALTQPARTYKTITKSHES